MDMLNIYDTTVFTSNKIFKSYFIEQAIFRNP